MKNKVFYLKIFSFRGEIFYTFKYAYFRNGASLSSSLIRTFAVRLYNHYIRYSLYLGRAKVLCSGQSG